MPVARSAPTDRCGVVVVTDTVLLPDRRVHGGSELLRSDLLQEDLVEVGQHGISLRGAERLVPRQGEVRGGVLGQAIDVAQEVLVGGEAASLSSMPVTTGTAPESIRL